MCINAETDIYASDEAWTHWFEKCAVKLCSSGEQRRLRQQIESAFFFEIRRHDGVSTSDYEREDICDLFDQYFFLHGDVDRPKALKAYYCDRIDPSAPDGMKKLICGTFFSHRCGRIKDIVRESISLVKGWRPRWTNTSEGKKLIWERPLEPISEDGSSTIEPVCFPTAFVHLDRDDRVWRHKARQLLDFLHKSSENNVSEVPILVYAIVNGVSPSNVILQKTLDVKQVQCYKKMNKMRERMRHYMQDNDILCTDTLIVSALRNEIIRHIDASVLNLLAPEVGEEWQ